MSSLVREIYKTVHKQFSVFKNWYFAAKEKLASLIN